MSQDNFNKAIEEIRTTIHTDYEWLKLHTDLQIKALKWAQKKDASRLLRGKELQEAEEQLTENSNQEDPQPTKLQREYILASRRSEERLKARTTAGLGIGLLVVLVLAILFWTQRNTAISQRAIAVSRALAINANDALGTDDGSLSLLLALESVSATYSLDGSVTPEAESILRRAISTSPWRETIVGRLGAIISMVEHNGLVAVTDDDTTVRLWNVNSGDYVTILNQHLESADAIAFSPSGEFLAVAGGDGTVGVWNVDTLREAAVFRGHTKIVNALAFNPDGNLLATASSDTTVRLWNMETARQEAIFKGHTDRVNGMAFNPHGELLATASDDGTVRLWDMVTGREVIILQNSRPSLCPPEGHELVFRPDGKFLAATGSGCGANLWNTESWQQIKIGTHSYPTHKVPCPIKGDAVFYEQTILTTGCDGVIRSWDVVSGAQIEIIGNLYKSAYERLEYGNYRERNIAVIPDALLAATIPGGVMLWTREFSGEIGTPWQDHMLLRGHNGQVKSMIIHSDTITTAGEDGTFRFWNASNDAALTEADEPRTIEELMVLARQRVQRNPPELTCEERLEYLHEKIDCLITPTP